MTDHIEPETPGTQWGLALVEWARLQRVNSTQARYWGPGRAVDLARAALENR